MEDNESTWEAIVHAIASLIERKICVMVRCVSFRKPRSVDKRSPKLGILFVLLKMELCGEEDTEKRGRTMLTMRHEKTLRVQRARRSLGCAAHFRIPEPITVHPSHVEPTVIHRRCSDVVCVRINLVERSR